jgi:hypothetical protein
MYELDHRREFVMAFAAVTEGAGLEYHQDRAQTFAPAADDVLRYLPYERDFGSEAAAYDFIHRRHVRLNEFAYCLERHDHRRKRGG